MKESEDMTLRIDSNGNGYDYDNQAMIREWRYISCAHPLSMSCDCYGKINAGKAVK